MDIQQLVNFAKESQGVLSWDTGSLIRVSGQLAVKVNTLQNLCGQEKQKLICQVLKLVLSDIEKNQQEGKSEEEKKTVSQDFAKLKQVVDDIIPASLDLAISAARGKLDLKKVKMGVWVRYFSCCASSVVKVLVSQNVISQEQAKKATTVLVAVEAKALAGCEGPANEAAGVDVDEKKGETKADKEEEKTAFEQENPMHAKKDESSTQESKPEEHVKNE
jgi:hypothetical protein